MYKEEKRSVGRPKLADSKLKKTSIIMCVFCLIAVIGLLILGAYKLNIIKLKGTASDTYDIGDKICFADECFIVISDNHDGTISALAQYNLLVGERRYHKADDSVYSENDYRVTLDPSTPGYGLQSVAAAGMSAAVDGDTVSTGQILFDKRESKDSFGYWHDEETGKPNDPLKYGDSYPAYVFDESSELWGPIKSYENYFNNDLKLQSAKMSLLTLDQAINLGCQEEKYTCSQAPAWFKQTTFWLGTATSGKNVYYFWNGNSYFGSGYTTEEILIQGVRPVLTINKSEIPSDRGMPYKYGQEICLKDECFEVVGYRNNKVIMMAKYNLYVGDIYYPSTNKYISISKDEKGYGLQSKYAKGKADGEARYIGVTKFSDNKYWLNADGSIKSDYVSESLIMGDKEIPSNYYVVDNNSPINEILNNYQKYLIDNNNKQTLKVKLFDYETFVYMFNNAYTMDYDNLEKSFEEVLLKQMSSWTGIVDESGKIIYFSPNGFQGVEPNTNLFGVRPVIVIDRDDLETQRPVTTTKSTTKATTKKSSSDDSIDTNEEIVIHKYKKSSGSSNDSAIKTTTKAESFIGSIKIIKLSEYNKTWLTALSVLFGMLLVMVIYLGIQIHNAKKD